ncbi:hypothetical protein V6Z11_A05G112700 [Gossypium hirsutum]|nr:hypothetical protein ES288_A05G112900v1 [Gossypium darwinii]
MIILLSQINCYSGNGYLFMENRLCPATQKDGSLEIRSSLREYVKKIYRQRNNLSGLMSFDES